MNRKNNGYIASTTFKKWVAQHNINNYTTNTQRDDLSKIQWLDESSKLKISSNEWKWYHQNHNKHFKKPYVRSLVQWNEQSMTV